MGVPFLEGALFERWRQRETSGKPLSFVWGGEGCVSLC